MGSCGARIGPTGRGEWTPATILLIEPVVRLANAAVEIHLVRDLHFSNIDPVERECAHHVDEFSLQPCIEEVEHAPEKFVRPPHKHVDLLKDVVNYERRVVSLDPMVDIRDLVCVRVQVGCADGRVGKFVTNGSQLVEPCGSP